MKIYYWPDGTWAQAADVDELRYLETQGYSILGLEANDMNVPDWYTSDDIARKIKEVRKSETLRSSKGN